MKIYTAGRVGDVCKILGTERHMKQYGLVEKTCDTKRPVVLSTRIGRLTKHTLKIESVAILRYVNFSQSQQSLTV